MTCLNRHAPVKQKCLRANISPFMNKILSKAIMLRSSLRNKYNKSSTPNNLRAYKTQRNKCVNLVKSVKKKYYSNLDTKIFKDNKKFWNSLKPLFSDKYRIRNEKIIFLPVCLLPVPTFGCGKNSHNGQQNNSLPHYDNSL